MPALGSFGGESQTDDPNQMLMQMMGMLMLMMTQLLSLVTQTGGQDKKPQTPAQGADGGNVLAPIKTGSLKPSEGGGTGTFNGKTPSGKGVSGVVASRSERLKNLDFRQDFEKDCGLAAISNMAQLQGKDISEQDVVNYARSKGLANPDGSTTPEQREQIAQGLGLSSSTQANAGINDIADAASSDKPAIVAVNGDAILGKGGGVNRPEDLDHVVSVVGVKKSDSGQVEGFYIVDTSNGDEDGVRFVSAEQMQQATGGNTYLQTFE